MQMARAACHLRLYRRLEVACGGDAFLCRCHSSTRRETVSTQTMRHRRFHRHPPSTLLDAAENSPESCQSALPQPLAWQAESLSGQKRLPLSPVGARPKYPGKSMDMDII